MNESLKTFVCKSENISCTSIPAKMKYSTTNKTTKITNQVEKKINFYQILID